MQKTILIVDDSGFNMKLTADLLELGGFNVLKASSGEIAVDMLKKQVPDMVLLDIQLPGMNGFDVLREIREEEKLNSVKIVALTARVMSDDETKIKEAGFDACIEKPINTREFARMIKGILG